MNRHIQFSIPRRQAGAALIVSLVLLIAVTLLGVSAMQGTIMQERMSANQRDYEEAFNAAEIALRRGEEEFLSSPLDYLGALKLQGLPRDWTASDAQWNDFIEIDDAPPGIAGGFSTRPPMYHIGESGVYCPDAGDLSSASDCEEIFTITARGTGRTDNTFVVIQSTIRRSD